MMSEGWKSSRCPEGWGLAYLHPGPPYRWSIFTPSAGPETVVRANFDHQLDLLGYDLAFDRAARALRVALYWRAATPVPDDYTIFLHLTAPDGFVKAQQDRQPFGRPLADLKMDSR